MKPFLFYIDNQDITGERQKARQIRASQWWKRCLAKGKCYYCKRFVSPQKLTMDHIVPIARGGRSTKGNLVTACKECNNAKKNLLPMEWDQYLKDFYPH